MREQQQQQQKQQQQKQTIQQQPGRQYLRHNPHPHPQEQQQQQQNMPSVVLQNGFGPSRLQIVHPLLDYSHNLPPIGSKVLSKHAPEMQTKQEPLAPLH